MIIIARKKRSSRGSDAMMPKTLVEANFNIPNPTQAGVDTKVKVASELPVPGTTRTSYIPE